MTLGVIITATSCLLGFIMGIRRVPVNNFELTKRLATKTPYYSQAEPFEIEPPSYCEPSQINMVVRHGTRYPTAKVIKKIAKTTQKLKALGESMPAWLEDWNVEEHYPIDLEAQLAPTGVEELVGLGDRIRQKYGLHFDLEFNLEAYTFEHTYKIRTAQSAKAFAHGYFNNDENVQYQVAERGQDIQLRFFDNCMKFTDSVDNNETAWKEYADFPSSLSMQENLIQFQTTLNSPSLTVKDLDAAYEACAFDVAVHHTTDHWCTLFSSEVLESMEYFKDLKSYYKKSYGNALSYEIAAPLLESILTGLQARALGSKKQGHFRFAHAETILPLSSLLGYKKGDRPLQASAIQQQRLFKGAEVSPFGANIGLILYTCQDKFLVQLIVNEKQHPIPGLDCIYCPLDDVLLHYEQWTIHSFEQLCQLTFQSSLSLTMVSTSSVARKLPLDGLRVIECGHLIAGPFAGMILAYFGAEVIKIEPRTGDQVRDMRLIDKENRTSLWWYSLGRNKHSVCIDLNTAEGRSIVKQLVNKSDVFIENFRPGKMEAWNLGPKEFENTNPELIYTRVSGYGQTGPYKGKPGFASVCEAFGGFRYVNGFPDRPSARPNLSLGDTMAGLHAALGVTMALVGKERSPARQGQVVDVAIYESMFNVLEAIVPEYSYNGTIRECSGSTITGIVPSNTYPTKDKKQVVIGANMDGLYAKLMDLIGAPHLKVHKTNVERVEYVADIDEAIGKWTSTLTLNEVLAKLDEAKVPVGPINSIAEMTQDPHYAARNMFESVEIPGHSKPLQIPSVTPKLSGTPGQTKWPGKPLGADTKWCLSSVLGMSQTDIEKLLRDEIVFDSRS
ncbi:formyl-coenzyme A transferase [Thraustotheca clavata]|uniref:Formyl-coenzyme A transferase n=1 Tax=Thraustotheca clavata TaxID=74557 RepID=A0A1V9Z5M2_9STRA|nr:formyl-coenzyme A transferase [Thraustotheca clavata]